MDNHIFKWAMIISLAAHAILLTRLSYSNTHYRKRPLKKMEVVYHRPVPTNEKREAPPKPQKAIEEKKLNKDSKVLLKRSGENTEPLMQNVTKLSTKLSMEKKLSSKANIKPPERRISVPELKSEKINNPIYLNYYQIVRNRIKDRAYSNYSKSELGSVYLTFVLLSDGTLKQINLVESKSNANIYLREVGVRSVKEASPFPAFPKDLRYPELSFNVVISFEMKD